ncbi:MAG: hypothetical protein CM15mV149_060 [uncultured marine virus]|nr:MAG: hypothetical protein CM15mV149_060 [uncultured marine virus]
MSRKPTIALFGEFTNNKASCIQSFIECDIVKSFEPPAHGPPTGRILGSGKPFAFYSCT